MRSLSPLVYRVGPTRVNPLGFLGSNRLTEDNLVSRFGDALELWLKPANTDNLIAGGSRQLYRDDKTSMQHADSAFFSTGDIDFLWCGWVYLTSTSSQQSIVSKWVATGSNREFSLQATTAPRFRFSVSNNGSDAVTVTDGTSITTGRWYLLMAWHDSSANTINIQVNNGTVQSQSHTTGVRDGTGLLIVGAQDSPTDSYSSAKIANLGFFKNAAARTTIDSATIRTWLYNYGNGRLAGEVAAHATLGPYLDGTSADYFNLAETSGTADGLSYSGSNDLTPTFTTITANGTFAADSDWTKGTGWTIGSGMASSDGSQSAVSNLSQAVGTSGHRYQITYTVSGYSAGTIACLAGTTTGTARSANGTYVETVTANGTAIGVQADADFVGSVDNFTAVALDIPAANGPSTDVCTDEQGNHGFFNGSPDSWRTDVPSALGSGLSLAFDGVDDYVSISHPGNPASLTVAGWLKIAALPVADDLLRIIGGGANSWVVYVKADGKVYLGKAGVTEIASSSAIPTGAWVHIAVTYNGTTAKFYINGALDRSVAYSAAFTYSGEYRIGTFPTYGGYFAQSQDDLRLYSVVKTDAEVLALSQGTDDQTGIVGHWKFDDGAASPPSDGEAILELRSGEGNRVQLQQATAGLRGTYSDAAVNGKGALKVDGTDDYYSTPSVPTLSATTGRAVFCIKTPSTMTGDQVLFAVADTGSANNYVEIGLTGGKLYIESNAGGTVTRARGGTTLSANTTYRLTVETTGSAWALKVNDSAETLTITGSNSGRWFGDVSGPENMSYGATKASSVARYAPADILLLEAVFTDKTETDALLTQLNDYLDTEYGL